VRFLAHTSATPPTNGSVKIPEIDYWSWSDWAGLRDAKALNAPATSGLYRVRDSDSESILYVGETGGQSGLRGRLNHLRTCYRSDIPYADPHTAAPALWAYLADGGGPLEVSILEVDSDKPTRRALEATAISLLRQEYGESPLLSFGRMPNGWIKSSGNNKRLLEQGKRMKGYRDPLAQRIPSLPSILSIGEDPKSPDWCGLQWSEWSEDLPAKHQIGLYRISTTNQPGLLYVGEGQIRNRVITHRSKALIPDHPQSDFFGNEILVSWSVTPDLEDVQRHELENDLIASHFLTLGSQPPAQFIG
jgi:hypothetical protein